MKDILDDKYLASLDKRLRELRREVEEELGVYRDREDAWFMTKDIGVDWETFLKQKERLE